MVAKNNYFWTEGCKEIDFIANGDIAVVRRVRRVREAYGFRFAMKGHHAGPDRGQIDLQEPEGLGVDDVEASASVHEDLGERDVADDGVDNERILPRARHTIGVVALVEGDGLVRRNHSRQ